MVVLGAPPRNAEVRLDRQPRLPGKADLLLWRHVLSDRVVFGSTRRPVFVRATTPEGGRALSALGGDASRLGSWQLVRWDDSKLLSAMDAGVGLELSTAHPHQPQLHLSIPEIKVDQVWAGRGLE